MDDEQYMSTQAQLTALAAVVRGLDIKGFIERINHAEAVVPILDPTLWMKGSGNLEKIKNIAVAARSFQKVVIEVMKGEK